MQHETNTSRWSAEDTMPQSASPAPRRGWLSLLADRGWMMLPVVAALLVGVVVYKQQLEVQRRAAARDARDLQADRFSARPAPRFEAYNEQMEVFRLESYLGRHPVLLIFFDGKLGADRDPLLAAVRENMPRINDAGVKVVAVSPALPQQNRKVLERFSQPFPFALLSDPAFIAHQLYDRWDTAAEQPRPGVFYIDRAGRVAWSHGYPAAWQNLPAELSKIWPDGDPSNKPVADE